MFSHLTHKILFNIDFHLMSKNHAKNPLIGLNGSMIFGDGKKHEISECGIKID